MPPERALMLLQRSSQSTYQSRLVDRFSAAEEIRIDIGRYFERHAASRRAAAVGFRIVSPLATARSRAEDTGGGGFRLLMLSAKGGFLLRNVLSLLMARLSALRPTSPS